MGGERQWHSSVKAFIITFSCQRFRVNLIFFPAFSCSTICDYNAHLHGKNTLAYDFLPLFQEAFNKFHWHQSRFLSTQDNHLFYLLTSSMATTFSTHLKYATFTTLHKPLGFKETNFGADALQWAGCPQISPSKGKHLPQWRYLYSI